MDISSKRPKYLTVTGKRLFKTSSFKKLIFEWWFVMLLPVSYISAIRFWLNVENAEFINSYLTGNNILIDLPYDYKCCTDIESIRHAANIMHIDNQLDVVAPFEHKRSNKYVI